MSGTAGLGEAPVEYATPPVTASASPVNTSGFNSNDLALLMDKQPQDTAGTYSPCLIEQVKSPFTGGSASATLDFAGSYYFSSTAGKSLSGMSADGYIANIGNIANGNAPLFIVLGVGDNNTLFSYDLLQAPTAPLPVADSVFEMHALYGINIPTVPAHSGIDAWVSPSDTSAGYTLTNLMAGNDVAANLLKNIKAIKIGLIMRTSLPEKVDTTNGVYVAPSSLTLFKDTSIPFTRNFAGNELTFRYRVVETTIPLRNILSLQ
jgi:type IV pilus assembly protein PilW